MPQWTTLRPDPSAAKILGQDYAAFSETHRDDYLVLLREAGKTAVPIRLSHAIESIRVERSPFPVCLHIATVGFVTPWPEPARTYVIDMEEISSSTLKTFAGPLTKKLPDQLAARTLEAAMVPEMALVFSGRLGPETLKRIRVCVLGWNVFGWRGEEGSACLFE